MNWGDAIVSAFTVNDFPLLLSREHLLPLIIFAALPAPSLSWSFYSLCAFFCKLPLGQFWKEMFSPRPRSWEPAHPPQARRSIWPPPGIWESATILPTESSHREQTCIKTAPSSCAWRRCFWRYISSERRDSDLRNRPGDSGQCRRRNLSGRGDDQ